MIKKVAKIESTMLGYEDHGILTVYLHVNYGGSGQGIGGFALDYYEKDPDERVVCPHAMEFITGVMRACGVGTWEGVKGRTVYALFDTDDWNAQPIGLENLPTEPGKRFLFAEWRAKVKAAEGSKEK